MEIDVFEIIRSWIKSFNPTEKELKLAKERFSICLECEFKKELIKNKKWALYCGPCGCPIGKNIFTSQYGSCPTGKWNSTEDNYKDQLEVRKKSII